MDAREELRKLREESRIRNRPLGIIWHGELLPYEEHEEDIHNCLGGTEKNDF